MKKLLTVGIFFLCPALVHATLINGGFETGDLIGWQSIGDALVVDASFGTPPAAGTYQALVTNIDCFHCSPYPVDDQITGPYSGNSPVGAGLLGGELDAFLGLPSQSLFQFYEALTPGGCCTWLGSAIQQSFFANAGDILVFRYNYLTNEGFGAGGTSCPTGDFNQGPNLGDFGFVQLNGALIFLAYSSLKNSSTEFCGESGYNLFATTLTTSGLHSVAFGVVTGDGDPAVYSALLIDNLSVTSVAEPGSLFLFAASLAVLVAWRRRPQ